VAIALSGTLMLTSPAGAQTESTTIIKLDTPSADRPSSTRMMVSGWAADPTGTGTGVDRVVAYLGNPEAGGQDLGELTYGQPRQDVARLLGEARFTNTGFQLAIELPPGDHTLYVFAHLNTAGRDDGWSVYSIPFSASASVRPDPQAATLLGTDQPLVRTAAPAPASASNGGGSLRRAGEFTASNDNGAIRVTPSRHDPIPLDPLVPGMSSLLQESGLQSAEVADATGSGGALRNVATGQYSTGTVTMQGGGGTQCPGPNCPTNNSSVSTQLQNMPSSMVRELTGYNIPGLGTNTPCTPGTGPGACNPQTGAAQPQNPSNPLQQAQQRTAQNPLASNAPGNPLMQPAVSQGPACMQYGPNGQCLSQAGAQGPLGTTCLQYNGAQCAFYGTPQTPGTTPGAAPGTTTAGQPGANMAAGAGCAQWGSNGQCLSAATTAWNAGLPPNAPTMPGVATTQTNSQVPPTTALATTYGMPTAGATNPYPAGAPTSPAGTAGGVCLQFGAGGVCTRYQ
jgi:hypothetical protein